MNIELLLTQISSISKKYDLINQKTGGYFNVFEIANVATDEVTICRVLYEILNPEGSHYQGSKYLKLFFEYVLQLDISDQECQKASVFREYLIDSNRRIDLVIITESYFIPIEVKIYAKDQVYQCADYFKRAINSNMFYLTLHGNLPSEDSVIGLEKGNDENIKGVSLISFEKHIINWLYKCLEQKQTITIAPIREILLQFINIISKITGQLERGKDMEIKDILMKSSENIRSAFSIESSIKECKIELIRKLFYAIEKQLESQGKKKIDIYDYEGDKTGNFYEHKRSTYPGISYMYKQNVKKDTDILFRIEIDHSLLAGFCVAYKHESCKNRLSEQEMIEYLPNITPMIGNDWWAYWEYIPSNN